MIVEERIEANGIVLAAHLARPQGTGRVPGLILCHGYPAEGRMTAAATYPMLADRLAHDAGWAVLAFNFRGAGQSGGNFSIQGWIEDLRGVIDWMEGRADISGTWVTGASLGGSVAICEAVTDDRVRGICTLAAPATMKDWADDPKSVLRRSREMGLFADKDFPPDEKAWCEEIKKFSPLECARNLGSRELFVLQGTDDDTVAPTDARELFQAAQPNADIRMLYAGGHRLRHDPRAVALMLGWLDRQIP